MTITVIDTETSGRNWDKHELLEIAYIVYDDNWNVIEEYETKVKPNNIENAEPEALNINGYSAEEWEDAQNLHDVLPSFCFVIENSDLLLGQNLIFDLRFIANSCKRLNLPVPNFPNYIDTRAEAEQLQKREILENIHLFALCKHYDVTISGMAHTALVDCKSTANVWKKMSKDSKKPALWSYENSYDLDPFK